ncbi:MAG TPA: heavy-metal-associated domain-containing protein [Bacillota bacterium]|jgi:copper chaperone CopZ|nr:cation transporter [Bacillota bacterium]HOI38727.1 heavy-metal-associated domain-containing protein [Bacillota bacterium]HPU75317.1 heavy-metal-associated domain-containing protein [Bacillota bacterium]
MSDIRREMIMLSGLNCPTCAAKLEKAVQSTPGVTEAKVVFGAGSLNVEYDATVVPYERIAEVVSRMGMTVTARVPGSASR